MTPSYIRNFLDDVRLDVLRYFTSATLLITFFALWRVINFEPVPLPLFFLLVGVVVLSWGIRRMIPHSFIYARYMAFLGSNFLFALALIMFRNPYLPFFATLLIFANALFIWRGEIMSATGMFLLSVYLYARGDHAYPMLLLTFHMGFSVVVSWLVIYTLHTAIQWYNTMHGEARHLLEEVRDQRAVLARTLTSLEAAYATQRHIHQELMYARHTAEEALRMKERFAANISHELRTPINIILGFSEVMYLSPETYGKMEWSPLLTRDIHQIYRSSHYLMEMIDDILDLSYFEQAAFTINLEATHLSDFFHETAELASNLFRGTGLDFKVTIAPDLPTIEIDRTRIRQVILNLLNNSRRFTMQGFVHLRASIAKDSVLVSVQDSGSGIAPDKIPLIFGEYYQVDYSLSRKHGGAGLGLAISKKFINAHKGELWVESQEGVGSTFTFSLPVSEGRFKIAPAEVEPVYPRIVAINMSPDFLRQNLSHYLENFEVIFIDHIAQLAPVLQKYQPRLIIQNTHTLEASPFPIPHLQGNFSQLSALSESLQIQGYLTKPISPQKLIGLLNQQPAMQKLLVVDDAPDFCQLIERYAQMARMNIQVFKAYDGPEALALLQKHLPDLALVDLNMPDMSGLEVIQTMRSLPALATIPVYLFAAANYEFEETGSRQLILTLPDTTYPAEILHTMNAIAQALKQRYIRPA